MSDQYQRLQFLFDQYIRDKNSPEENEEFWKLVHEIHEDHPLAEDIKLWWKKYEGDSDLSQNVDSKKILDRILAISNTAVIIPAPVHHLRRYWMQYAVSILVLISMGVYFYLSNIDDHQQRVVQSLPIAPAKDIISPGYDKAMLTLSNGKQIFLDNTNRTIISDAGVEINKQADELIYGKTDIVAYNTMSTPRGGQYKLTLADGTKVWLNAESSITYPTVFINNERKIEMTGEAYFEVQKNAEMPFKVKLRDQSEILVTGTHFNVNAYADEPQMTTTLLEGSVVINNTVLKPGEAYSNGKISNADTEAAVAWKNGVFIFRKADIRNVMRQLSRWYDVEVKYEGNLRTRTFSGKIKRDLSLHDLLDGLKSTDVQFRIEGKTIIVK